MGNMQVILKIGTQMNADFQDFINQKDSKTQRKKYFFNLGDFVPWWQKRSYETLIF